MMRSGDDCAAAILLAVAIKRKKQKETSKRKSRIWSQEWFKKRALLGQTELLKELEYTSETDFNNYVRMTKPTFDILLNKIAHRITKQDTVMRDAIPPHHRLSLTLRFLASGNSFEDLKFLTAIAPQTIGRIVMETCEAIISELKDFIKLPKTENEWKEEANKFGTLWNFPNCIGAIDGKHINITQPPGTGSFYFNYKKTFSIILMAVVNANYEFMMIDAGTNGRASDAGVFSGTKFFSSLQNRTLNIPDPEPLPGCTEKMPFVFVADDAFPLSENIMKPYSHNTLKEDEIIFNYRLSRARRIVENAFGILASKFRVLLHTMNLSPQKATIVTLACCYLHNFLRKLNDETYIQEEEVSENHDFCYQPLQPTNAKNASNLAKNIRDQYCNYFNTVGAVSWQSKVLPNKSV